MISAETPQGLQIVEYSPVHNGDNLIPQGVTFRAQGSGGFDRRVLSSIRRGGGASWWHAVSHTL
jgi:hypothetical protein